MVLYLILVATTFVLWRIGKQIYLTYRCVGEDKLRAFWSGRLKKNHPEAYRQVVTHLGHCEKCQALLEEIRRGKPIEDHLVE